MKRKNKRPFRKEIQEQIKCNETWAICRGKLIPNPGRPDGLKSLFRVIAEKIPYDCLNVVRNDIKSSPISLKKAVGIYMAHDSMGYVRYAGRGNIFQRLQARKKVYPKELAYFSFYVIADKKHEREIETLIIRVSSPLLEFNDRKKRSTINIGNVCDYEANTFFYERQKKKGKKAVK